MIQARVLLAAALWALAISALPASAGADVSTSVIDSAEVDRQISQILEEPRFAGSRPETPFERIQRQIKDYLARQFVRLAELVGGNVPAAIIIVATVVGIAIFTALVLGRRRADDLSRRSVLERLVTEAGADPAELERLADKAGLVGDYAGAIRLRFVAGLLRLDQRGAITFAAGLPTFDIADAVESPIFDALAAQFDAISYGDRPATGLDHDRARDHWARLLETVAIS